MNLRNLRCALPLAALSTLLSLSFSAAHAAETPRSTAAVLADAMKASGGDPWSRIRTLHTRARVEASGLSGSGESWDEVTTGRHADTWKVGPATGGSGFDGTVSWQVDPSGQVTRARDGESYRGALTQAYLRSLSYWFPERRTAKLESLGTREIEKRRFEVVRAEPENGHSIELWFDAQTHLLERIVEGQGQGTQTTLLADYREVQGLKFPFSQRVTTGEAKFDTVLAVESIEVDGPFEVTRLAPPAERADDWTLAEGRSETTVPFDLANDHLYLEVDLDGHGALPFLFDTGGVNVVTPEAAKRLGLTIQGALEGQGVGEKSEEVALAQVGSVRVGDLTLRDQLFFVFPLAEIDQIEGRPIAGLIGFEVAKRLPVRIDYAGRKITFFSPREFKAPAEAFAIPIAFDERTPRVEGKVDGLAGWFSIDTGSRSALDLMSPFVEKNGLVAKYRTTPEVTTGWGVGGAAKSRVARIGTLELGGLEIPQVVTGFSTQKKGAMANPNLAGNVGGGVLKRFTVTLDYRNEKIYLDPNATFPYPDGFDRSGMWLRKVQDGFRIDDLVAEGPAKQAGLVIGDVIARIDGKPAGEITLSDFRRRLKVDAVGTKLALSVVREGQEREVEIVLRELVP